VLRLGVTRAPLVLVSTLGLTQILAWGSTYYLPAVTAQAIAEDTGWPFPWVVGGLSIGLFVAGLVSPRMGRAIEARGGRPVLAASSAVIALGLAALALAPSLPLFLAAWVVLGVGMGIGLYDAAFAALGRQFGLLARTPITVLTLFGGFASTVCWPLTTLLVETFGWRGACLTYAAIHLALALPAHLAAIPAPPARDDIAARDGANGALPTTLSPARSRACLWLLAAILTLAQVLVAVMSVHLIGFLRARGLELADAVALGMLIGPAQVGARVVEMALSRHHHPVWTLVASVALMAAGLAVLALGLPVTGVAIVIYASGVGIESIARGTVPLALFGARGYAALMGRLAMPILLAQAIAPPLAALAFDGADDGPILTLLALGAGFNVILAAAMLTVTRTAWRARPALQTSM